MRVPKIYLETTVFNFYFADDAPEKKRDTLKLFKEIKEGKYLPYTSDYAVNELNDAPAKKRQKMLRLLEEYGVVLIKASDEADKLAKMYVSEGIIPPKYYADGLHIAIATIMDLDFIVSLNYKHIVKRKTILLTEVVNVREGYKKVGIYSPMEVIEDDE